MIIVLHIVRYKYQVVYNANGGTGGPGTITTGWLDGTTGEDTFSYATAYKLTTAGGRGVWDYFDSNTDLNGVPSDMKPNAASKWIQMSKDFDIPSTQPTRSGYHFDGWSYTQNGSKISGTINVSASGTGNINTTISRTVYARWIPWYKYSLTFDPNGGTGGPGTVTSEEQETTSYSFVLGGYSTPTRKGYTFDGWYDAASGGNKVTTVTLSNSTVGSTASTTVYAHWAKNAYTATFNPAEGSVSPSSQTYYVDTPFTFPKPTRTGYKCTGWKVTSAAGDWTLNQTYSCESASPSNYIGDVTFTAQWAAQYKYDLTYDYNGGCKGVSPNLTYSRTDSSGWIDDASYTFTNSVMYNSSSYPWRTGWHMSGWYSDAAGTASVSQVTLTGTPAQTVSSTVYAIWYVDLTGSIDHGTVTNSSQSVKEGKNSAAMVFTPTAGYRITNVTFNDAGQTLSYPLDTYTFPAQTLSQDMTVAVTTTAYFSVTGTIDNSGTVTNNEQLIASGANNAAMVFTPFEGYEITSITVNGMKQSLSYPLGTYTYPAQAVTAAVEVKAFTSLKKHQVQGSIDHGNVTNSPQSVTHGTQSTAMAFTPDGGYKITGVKVNDTATSGYTDSGYTYPAQTITEPKTVVASTSAIQYTLTLNPTTGGSVTPSSIDYDVEDTFQLPTANFPGKEFSNWKVTTASGNWVKDELYNALTDITGKYGNATLTARYGLTSYTASFDSNGCSVTPASKGYDLETPFTFPTPEYPGYVFNGWKVKENAGTWKTSDSAYAAGAQSPENAIGNVTFVAQWEAVEYKLTYDADGGSVSPEYQDYTIEDSFSIPEPSKDGHTFTSWKVISDSAGSWTKNSSVSPGEVSGKYGTATLKAQYDINKYTVSGSFDVSTHGSVTGSPQYNVEYGSQSAAMKFTANTSDGWEIVGVKVNDTPVEGITADNPVDEYTYPAATVVGNVSVVATTALKKYTVCASVDDSDQVTMTGTTPQTVEHGRQNAEIKFSAKTGYEITSVTANGVPISGSWPVKEYTYKQTVTGDVTLVAYSGVKNYRVNISINGLMGDDCAIFSVSLNEVEKYTVSLNAAKSHVGIKNIQDGTSVKVRMTGWSHAYTATSETEQTKTVDSDKSFEFAVTPKTNSGLHSESYVTSWEN